MSNLAQRSPMNIDRAYMTQALRDAFADVEIALDTDDEDLFDHANAAIDGLMRVLRPGADDHMDAQ